MSQPNQPTLGTSLLQAGGIQSGPLPEEDKMELLRRIGREKARVRFATRLTKACWAALAGVYVLMKYVSIRYPDHTPIDAMTWNIITSAYFLFVCIAFYITVRLVILLGILRGLELNARLASIEHLLAATLRPRGDVHP